MQTHTDDGAAPHVSIVIPTRDRWTMLEAHGLASALRQEDASFEVVVVDDGSSDGTSQRLAALADERIRVVRHERPTGVARARNAGIAAARGTWIAFLDDDDIWAPRKLHLQLLAAQRNSADLVYSGAVHLDHELRVLAAFAPPPAGGLRERLTSGTSIPAGASNLVVRRRLVEQIGGFDTSLRCLEDHDCWLRLASVATAATTDEILVGYVQHDRAAHVRDMSGVLASFATYARKYRSDDDVAGLVEMEARYLRWISGQQRRAGRKGQAMWLYVRAAFVRRRARYLVRGLLQLAGEWGQRWVRLGTRFRIPLTPGPRGTIPDGQVILEQEPEWIALYRRPAVALDRPAPPSWHDARATQPAAGGHKHLKGRGGVGRRSPSCCTHVSSVLRPPHQ